MTRSTRMLGWTVRVAGIGVGGMIMVLTGAIGFVRLRSRGHLYTLDAVPTAPLGLVLGAQVYPSGRPSPFLAARLDLAVTLYRRGRIRAVLVSGDHQAPEYDEPAAMRRHLVSRGVPEARVITDGGGVDTHASCVRARHVFGLDRVIVLTQSYHLPRAVATARAVGLDAVGVGDDSVRAGSRAWRRGAVRDQVACVKTLADLLSDLLAGVFFGTTGRDSSDDRSEAVTRALRTPEQ